MTELRISIRIREALQAGCHPRRPVAASITSMAPNALAMMTDAVPLPGVIVATATASDVDSLVVELFEREGGRLVRLARLFVDDRNAAEDLVQEAFIRLARSAHKIKEARSRLLPAVDRRQPGP